MAYNAHQTLAEDQFNRYYLRGLCCYAIDRGIENLEIYRAMLSKQPRTKSKALIGTLVNVLDLLDDLIKNIGINTVLGLPPHVNSGISAKLP